MIDIRVTPRTLPRLLCFLVLLSSALANAELRVEEGYVRGLPPGQPVTAAFMRLVNGGSADIVLIGARSDVAERAEIHAHSHRNGMMRMEQVEQIVVPAGGEFVLKPGAHHLMLINLQRPLAEGDLVSLTWLGKEGALPSVNLRVRSVLNE